MPSVRSTTVYTDFEDEIAPGAALEVDGVSVGTDMDRGRVVGPAHVELTITRQAALRLEPMTLAPIRCRPQAGRPRSSARRTRPSNALDGSVTCTFAAHPTEQPRPSRG
jgi:hypothetical protein